VLLKNPHFSGYLPKQELKFFVHQKVPIFAWSGKCVLFSYSDDWRFEALQLNAILTCSFLKCNAWPLHTLHTRYFRF